MILSRPRAISYRNQSTDLPCKSMDWFLYDTGLGRERNKVLFYLSILKKIIAPFHWIWFTCLKTEKLLRGDTLHLTIKFSEVSSTSTDRPPNNERLKIGSETSRFIIQRPNYQAISQNHVWGNQRTPIDLSVMRKWKKYKDQHYT